MINLKFIEDRRLKIFNVLSSLYLLHGHRYMAVSTLTANMVTANLDALCGFTPAQSVQARDMLFDASDNGVIPTWVIDKIATCCKKLADIVAYSGLASQDHDLWMALYNLLEVECLYEAANPQKHDDGSNDGTWGFSGSEF